MKHTAFVAIISAIAFVFSGVCSQAQAPQSQDYQGLADKFFALLEQGKSDEAIDYMFSTNLALKNMPGKSEQLKSQFNELQSKLGSYHSRTILVETKVAGMFVYQHYFVAYELQPISLRLKFYKPRDTWRVFAVEFDTDLPDIITKQADQNLERQSK